jgi:hypothetical protein
MESILTIYNITTSLLTFYGYWKVANAAYDQYAKAKFFYDVTTEILIKLQCLIETVRSGKDAQALEKISECIQNMEYIEKELKDESGVPRFYCSDNLKWEILYEKEIVLEIESDNLSSVPLQSVTNYYYPNLVTFYSYIDENGREVTEF